MNIYLLEQNKLHEHMQPEDIIKMCYQATFGSEHILEDVTKLKTILKIDFNNAEPKNMDLYEDISEDYCRVNLAAWKYHDLPLQVLFDMYKESSPREMTGDDDFKALMDDYIETAKSFYSLEEIKKLKVAVEEYYKEGIHPMHHTETYHNMEKPNYRLIRKELLLRYLNG